MGKKELPFTISLQDRKGKIGSFVLLFPLKRFIDIAVYERSPRWKLKSSI